MEGFETWNTKRAREFADLIRVMYEDSCCVVITALKMVRCQSRLVQCQNWCSSGLCHVRPFVYCGSGLGDDTKKQMPRS